MTAFALLTLLNLGPSVTAIAPVHCDDYGWNDEDTSCTMSCNDGDILTAHVLVDDNDDNIYAEASCGDGIGNCGAPSPITSCTSANGAADPATSDDTDGECYAYVSNDWNTDTNINADCEATPADHSSARQYVNLLNRDALADDCVQYSLAHPSPATHRIVLFGKVAGGAGETSPSIVSTSGFTMGPGWCHAFTPNADLVTKTDSRTGDKSYIFTVATQEL